jgi:hypothetical protein
MVPQLNLQRFLALAEVDASQPAQQTFLILGYPYEKADRMCPYSQRTKALLHQHPECQHAFHVVPFGGGTPAVKSHIEYQGTFPLILLNVDGQGTYQAIGGSDDLAEFLALYREYQKARP